MASWWILLTPPRLAWSTLGRRLGFYDISTYHRWLIPALPWRPLYRPWLRLRMWWKEQGYGAGASAAWAGLLTILTNPYGPGNSIYLGLPMIMGIGLHQPVGVAGEGHAMLIGNTGSGKTRFLLAWLGSLHRSASAFVIDCGAQASNALGNALRRAGHRVSVWDPFGLSKFISACWNPLDELTRAAIRHGRAAVVRFAMTIAHALVKSQNQHQPIFDNGAREFITALILYVWVVEPLERKNLVRARQLLTLGLPERVSDPAKQEAFDALLEDMIRTTKIDDGCGGAITAVIARGAGVMKSGKNREGNPFRTSAIVATEFLDIPEVASTLLRSDFTVESLKKSNDCLFICAPVDDLRSGKLAGFVRMLSVLTAYTFQSIPERRKIPCAMFLDEAPSVGIEDLPIAAANYRKNDIRLVVATQDLALLETAYPGKAWRTLMGSAEVRIWLSNGEPTTIQYLCDELGARTVTERIEGGSWLARALGLSNAPVRYQRVERPLLYPHQASQYLDRGRGHVIVTRTGKFPFRLKYEPFDRALAIWRFDQDPHFREPFGRAAMRALFSRYWTGETTTRVAGSHASPTPAPPAPIRESAGRAQ